MVGLTSLWLPILLSAVVVFILSSVIHMVLGYHNTDFTQFPGEEGLRAAIGTEVPPGMYAFPHPGDPKKMNDPEHVEKRKHAPVGYMVLTDPGMGMGKTLIQWFVYCLFVSFFVAYVAGRTTGVGADYLQVFRVAGVTGFMAYAFAGIPNSIWWGQRWNVTIKNTIDGLIFGLFTAGVFGWLWP